MQIPPELKTVLKRLKLSGILATLPDRWAYARQEKLDYPQFLELVLSDEVERRDHKHIANRLARRWLRGRMHPGTLRLVRQNPPRQGPLDRTVRPALPGAP